MITDRRGRTLGTRATSSCALWLLNHLHLVCEVPALFRHPACRGFRLVRDGHDTSHGGGKHNRYRTVARACVVGACLVSMANGSRSRVMVGGRRVPRDQSCWVPIARYNGLTKNWMVSGAKKGSFSDGRSKTWRRPACWERKIGNRGPRRWVAPAEHTRRTGLTLPSQPVLYNNRSVYSRQSAAAAEWHRLRWSKMSERSKVASRATRRAVFVKPRISD